MPQQFFTYISSYVVDTNIVKSYNHINTKNYVVRYICYNQKVKVIRLIRYHKIQNFQWQVLRILFIFFLFWQVSIMNQYSFVNQASYSKLHHNFSCFSTNANTRSGGMKLCPVTGYTISTSMFRVVLAAIQQPFPVVSNSYFGRRNRQQQALSSFCYQGLLGSGSDISKTIYLISTLGYHVFSPYIRKNITFSQACVRISLDNCKIINVQLLRIIRLLIPVLLVEVYFFGSQRTGSSSFNLSKKHFALILCILYCVRKLCFSLSF